MQNKAKSRKNIKDTFIWSCLELLIVPVFLTGISFYLNESINRRERMKDYLTDVTELASKAEKDVQGKKLKLTDSPMLKSLVRARTLTILKESSETTKREIIEFIANSDLQYQFSLELADLHNTNLSGLYLKDADLRRADLRDANLTGAELTGVDLRGALIDGAKLNGVKYDSCTDFDDALRSRIDELKWNKLPRDEIHDPCHHKNRK